MKKLILSCSALLLLLAVVVWAADNATTVKGWVTDAKCGVKGAHAGAEECARKCISQGEKTVVVTDNDKQVLYVDNPDALKEHIGHHVAVQGTVEGNKLHVNSAEMAEAETQK
jgi:hypothetical protein